MINDLLFALTGGLLVGVYLSSSFADEIRAARRRRRARRTVTR